MVLTIVLDSWYYGEPVVVPWRFIRFNVVSGLSAHYGTLPWHWYMSQGVPVILATHLLPFCLALYHQPARHQSLMSVILWSLLVYRWVEGVLQRAWRVFAHSIWYSYQGEKSSLKIEM